MERYAFATIYKTDDIRFNKVKDLCLRKSTEMGKFTLQNESLLLHQRNGHSSDILSVNIKNRSVAMCGILQCNGKSRGIRV